MPAVFENRDGIVEVGSAWIARLKRSAARAPLRRSRLCLHRAHGETVQEMVIAFRKGSLVRPHRHPGRSESLHMIEGRLTVLVFDEAGRVRRRIDLSALPTGEGESFMDRIGDGAWHTVVPTSDYAVAHEASAGPFDPDADNFAPWAPAEVELLRAFVDRAMIEGAALRSSASPSSPPSSSPAPTSPATAAASVPAPVPPPVSAPDSLPSKPPRPTSPA